ncbi:hypothetical protein OH77DRAFT_1590073 [Trametes cingulata]|nr:hypothetical protein OH77DRAFT_1590073 [Trametes cingulata]
MAITRNNTPRDDQGEEDAEARIFTINGRPVLFYLYGTSEPRSFWALSEGQRKELAALITQHGGHICKSPRDADTIIVTPNGHDQLSKKYELERTKYVELPSFVRRCIRKGHYVHDPVIKLPMGGVPPKRARTEFTPEDDRNLCRFLASYLPYPEAGGRLGISTYLTLMEKARYPDLDYGWAARHTAESWRERYKKKQAIFDPIIAQMVKQNPPPLDGKGVRPHDRRVNGRGPLRYIHLMEEEEEEEDQAEDEYEQREQEEPGEFEHEANDAEGEQEARRAAPQPQPRSRHTDVGPRVSVSPVEQRRGRVQSAPFPRTAQRREEQVEDDEDMGEFSYHPENENENYEPGPEDAGPSGTQHTPSPAPPPPRRTQNQLTQKPLARPRAGVIARELSAAAQRANQAGPSSQGPMSSQATLVGPVPTQLRGAAEAAKLPPVQPRPREESEPAPTNARAAKRRKIVPLPPAPPVVVPEPLRERGTGPSRSAAEKGKQRVGTVAARKTASSVRPESPPAPSGSSKDDEDDSSKEGEDDGMRSSDEGFEIEEGVPQSHGVVPTLEDERDVEAQLLQGTADTSGRISPDDPFVAPSQSEELESDDERTREKLLPAREGHSRTSSMASSRKLLMISRLSRMGEMEVDFAKSLDLTRPATRERSVAQGGQGGARPSRVPATPQPQFALGRVTTEGSTSSLEGVPLAGTRASAHKEQSREYVPPPGTKARTARESGLQPTPPKLELRSRVVNRQRKP